MPIYEYKCTKCGEVFEMLRNLNEDDRSLTCPRCHAESPERILSLFSSASSPSSGSGCEGTGFT